jgi:hypothetical protein
LRAVLLSLALNKSEKTLLLSADTHRSTNDVIWIVRFVSGRMTNLRSSASIVPEAFSPCHPDAKKQIVHNLR